MTRGGLRWGTYGVAFVILAEWLQALNDSVLYVQFNQVQNAPDETLRDFARAEHEAQARILGEPSSSKPNFVGEENGVILPWSGAITSISNRYHETIPGDRRQWIEPRPRIELRSADYFANRDPVLESLLRLR